MSQTIDAISKGYVFQAKTLLTVFRKILQTGDLPTKLCDRTLTEWVGLLKRDIDKIEAAIANDDEEELLAALVAARAVLKPLIG